MIVAEPLATSVVTPFGPPVEGRLKVMIAGGGIGGLCTALVLQKQGHDVHIYEKATSYRPFGGPIQIASNALESLKRIDQDVYNAILEKATGIGTRKNGLKDGLSNEWFATFDLYAPARRRGQDSSVVIDRPILQEILLAGIGGERTVSNGCEVTGYTKHKYSAPGNSVTGMLSNGSSVQCDLLIGSDGINSKVREELVPTVSEPVWSGYTCFAAIAQCVPDDIATVGYKIWLGSRKYFVSVDVGGGRIQWYAFLNLPPNSLSLDGGEAQIDFLRDEFDGWSPEVQQLLGSTPFDQVEQRDLFDRAPEFKWADGHVCLLGDAVHPMMPNLGQGGGMAIEDALVLGQELRPELLLRGGPAVPLALGRYQQNRVVRAAAVQGMSRASSAILFQYNHPTIIDLFAEGGPKVSNLGPRSLITRMCQGFMQNVAFPLQFEFLFSFPGPACDPKVFSATESAEDALVNPNFSLREWFNRYW
jgi:zeaxanthin epoxidase